MREPDALTEHQCDCDASNKTRSHSQTGTRSQGVALRLSATDALTHSNGMGRLRPGQGRWRPQRYYPPFKKSCRTRAVARRRPVFGAWKAPGGVPPGCPGQEVKHAT